MWRWWAQPLVYPPPPSGTVRALLVLPAADSRCGESCWNWCPAEDWYWLLKVNDWHKDISFYNNNYVSGIHDVFSSIHVYLDLTMVSINSSFVTRQSCQNTNWLVNECGCCISEPFSQNPEISKTKSRNFLTPTIFTHNLPPAITPQHSKPRYTKWKEPPRQSRDPQMSQLRKSIPQATQREIRWV